MCSRKNRMPAVSLGTVEKEFRGGGERQRRIERAEVGGHRACDTGVISAIAIMSETLPTVIYPCEIIAAFIKGGMESPPKLMKPIFTKLQKSSTGTTRTDGDDWYDGGADAGDD